MSIASNALSGVHQILQTKEHVTPYTTNTTQTWRLVLLCIYWLHLSYVQQGYTKWDATPSVTPSSSVKDVKLH